MMDLKNCHMGVCKYGGVNLFDKEKDEYVYLSGDDLGGWHNEILASSPFSVELWFGDGSIMVLPKEYLL